MTQSQALEILKTGANVFLTGEPGSGKTHTIREYIRYLEGFGVNVAVTASTGIAATHIGGMTIHSWSGIGIKNYLDSYSLDKISSTEYVVKRVKKAHVLIIDEVSMLPPSTLQMVDLVCREIRQIDKPFGGIQMVLVGDFFQLPPIVKSVQEDEQEVIFEENPPRFCYNSSVWQKLNPLTCYLTEQYRQDDSDFLLLLSAIRTNTFNSKHLETLRTRKIISSEMDIPKLFSHNVDVDRINEETLAKLSGELRIFSMSSSGPAALTTALKKGCLSPETLSLKKGTIIMFTKNNPKEYYVNGTLGRVEGFNSITREPLVRTNLKRQILVSPLEWTIEDGGKIKARISQLPLRLAWAITVHKSQGMSMDKAMMDLSGVFEYGQGYVALSRVRRLSGLYLLGWNDRTFQVHPEILESDAAFRSSSEEAQDVFEKMKIKDLDQMHKNFLRVCGVTSLTKTKKRGKIFQ